MDLFWIKTLARSKRVAGRWQLENLSEVKKYSRTQVNRAAHDLYDHLNFAISTFNEHVDGSEKLFLCPMQPDSDGRIHGFSILVSHFQLRLESSSGKIKAVLESTEGFRRTTQQSHLFEARFDALGGLSWCMDARLILTTEAIAKQLLHDIWSLVLTEKTKGMTT